jgi:hypothetical protein
MIRQRTGEPCILVSYADDKHHSCPGKKIGQQNAEDDKKTNPEIFSIVDHVIPFDWPHKQPDLVVAFANSILTAPS